jgi:checkpoint serine/threonine-protein kinase
VISHSQPAENFAAIHAQFRRHLTPITTEDVANNDPLDTYCRYIGWIIETSSSIPSSDNGLLTLLEETARAFCGEPCIESDRAYVRVWLDYASLVSPPAADQIYAFMLANNIGSTFPHPYELYALSLERQQK